MKKLIALVIVFTIALPSWAFAQVQKSDNIQIHYFTYDSSRDQYILDYTLSGYANAVVTVFITPTGTTYTKEWGSWTVNRRIFHNCNGTFNYNFTVNDKVIGYIYGLETTQIQNEVCSQKIPGTDPSDVNPTINDRDDGGKRITYTKDDGSGNNGGGIDPSGHRLEISRDGGQTWDSFADNPIGSGGGGTYQTGYFDVPYPGYYRIVTYDENNNTLSTDYIDESEFENTSTCNGCKTLSEMIACPAWDDYVGDLSSAIAEAIPPPPPIEDGMNYLIEKLAEQDVEPIVPDPPAPYDPGYEEQQIDLPEKIETDINPSPTDFEPVTEGEGEGAISLIDPNAWVPDDTDIGYQSPDPDSINPKEYEYTDDPQNPPDYDFGNEETIPDYDYNETNGQLPNYEYNDTGNIPDYETGNQNGGGVPDYNYN